MDARGIDREDVMDKKRLVRKIVDYLHKYAREDQLIRIAKFLGINTEDVK